MPRLTPVALALVCALAIVAAISATAVAVQPSQPSPVSAAGAAKKRCAHLQGIVQRRCVRAAHRCRRFATSGQRGSCRKAAAACAPLRGRATRRRCRRSARRCVRFAAGPRRGSCRRAVVKCSPLRSRAARRRCRHSRRAHAPQVAPAVPAVPAADVPPARGGPPAAFPSRLQTRGTSVVDSAGAPIRLVGLNALPVWEDLPGSTWGPEQYAHMRAQGFNVVRFPIHWSAMEPQRGRFDATHLATLDRAIGYARAAGLYVVLDPVHIWSGEHFVPDWARRGDVIGDIEANAAPYLRMLGARYRYTPAVAAIDLVSEPPMDPPNQNRVLRMYDGLIRAVRRVAPSTILMFNCVGGDTSMANADLRLLSDRRNLVFTMYDYYAGGPGDGYNSRGGQNTRVAGGTGYYTYDEATGYPNANPAELERHLLVNLNVMRRAGFPMWMGAQGINPNAVNAERWVRDKVALYRKYGLGFAWWLHGNRDGFATMDANGEFKPFVRLLR